MASFLLQETALNKTEITRLLGMKTVTLDQRTFKRQVAYGYGCRINAHVNSYLPMDGFTILAGSMLHAQGIRLEDSAKALTEKWEKVHEMVQAAEADPRYGTKVIIPGVEQLFIVAAIRKDGKLVVGTGLYHEALGALGGGEYLNPVGISIQRVLHQLRANAEHNKVRIPERLTMQPDDPEYPRYLEQIENYQRLAFARFKTKTKTKGKAKVTA